MKSKLKLPMASVMLLWLLPISVLAFLVVAITISAYESEFGYFVSIFSLFFMLINVVANFILSFMLCRVYCKLTNDGSSKLMSYLKALIFNVFGGYHYMKKIKKYSSGHNILIEETNKASLLEVYYVFFLAISIVVSLMMSKGVET